MKKSIKILATLSVIAFVLPFAIFLGGCVNLGNIGGNPCNCDHHTPTPTIFQVFRQTRQQDRIIRLQALENIIINEHFQEYIRHQAEQEMLAMLHAMEFEMIAEALIFATGYYQDVIVVKNGENFNVLIRYYENLSFEQAENILKILRAALNDYIPENRITIAVVNT